MALEAEDIREPFTAWLAERWPARSGLRIGEILSPKSGFSAQTLILPVSVARG